MVAPDLAGQGLGRWLLRFAETQAPDEVESITLFTGARSTRTSRCTNAPAFSARLSLRLSTQSAS